MQPHRAEGFEPNPDRMGFLDFIRELRQDTFPFGPSQKLMLVGLEDVLLAAGQNVGEVQAYIREVLAGQANNLDRKLGSNIQIVFRCSLGQADDFWFEVGARNRVSLKGLFHSARHHSEDGNECYIVGVNLT